MATAIVGTDWVCSLEYIPIYMRHADADSLAVAVSAIRCYLHSKVPEYLQGAAGVPEQSPEAAIVLAFSSHAAVRHTGHCQAAQDQRMTDMTQLHVKAAGPFHELKTRHYVQVPSVLHKEWH